MTSDRGKKAGERLLSAETGAGTLRAASADVPLPPPDPAACSSTPGMPPGGLFCLERLFLPKRRPPAAQSARTIPPRAFLSPARAFPLAAPFRKTPASSIRVGKLDAAPGHATIKRPVGVNKRRQPFLPLIPCPSSVPRTGKNAPSFRHRLPRHDPPTSPHHPSLSPLLPLRLVPSTPAPHLSAAGSPPLLPHAKKAADNVSFRLSSLYEMRFFPYI